jgi:hypothetical protein
MCAALARAPDTLDAFVLWHSRTQNAGKKGLLFGWRVCTCVGRRCVSLLAQPALHLARPFAPDFVRRLCTPIHLLLLSSKTVSPFPFLKYLSQKTTISNRGLFLFYFMNYDTLHARVNRFDWNFQDFQALGVKKNSWEWFFYPYCRICRGSKLSILRKRSLLLNWQNFSSSWDKCKKFDTICYLPHRLQHCHGQLDPRSKFKVTNKTVKLCIY